MEQEFAGAGALNLEEVQQRFEGWRLQRKRGTPIPGALWDDAVGLCASHSLSKVCGALHLDYNVLKNAFSLHSPIVLHNTQLHAHKAKLHIYNL